MWWNSSKSSQYSALGTGSDDLIAEDTKLEPHIHPPRPRWREALLRIAPWIAHFVLLLISSSLLTRATQLYERSQCWSGPPVTHEHAQAVVDVGSQLSHTFDGDFFAESIYRGAPSPERDAAWGNLYNTGGLAVSRDDMLRIQKLFPSSVELPEEPEESYQAGLEVFHQIHCLDLIRKYTYFEYYSALQPNFAEPMMRIHTDHCIDILRQTLMCNSDLHVFTYNWVDRVDHAWPDFSTTKMCRNFDSVLAWGNEHHAYTSAAGGMIKRPQNASMLHVPSNDELHHLLEPK